MQNISRPASGYPAPAPYSHSNGAAAYPYVAPPPYSQSQYPDPGRNRPTKCSTLCIILSIILVASAVFALAVWSIKMEPTFPDFEVDSLSLTNFSADSYSLTGTWSIGFLVRNNDERWNVNYENLKSFLIYKDSCLLETKLVPFTQGTESEDTWNVKLSITNAYVEPDDINDLIVERLHGSIGFDFMVSARACWYGSGAWNYRFRWLSVLCHDVPVGISSNTSEGKLTGGARQCRVQLY